MTSNLVFDTNYIRKLGGKEYLESKVPQRFGEQIQLALNRGDAVLIPRTVQLELNAWIRDITEKEADRIKQAKELLVSNGYKIEPNNEDDAKNVDTFEVIKANFPGVYLIEPSPETYLEAERRTSYREPPLPKNPEGEEFRDRLIWCQLLNISDNSDLPIVIVSEDKIFENGANSEEGKKRKITNLKTEEELNQWLDQRPDYVQRIINDLLLFINDIASQGVSLAEDDVERIVDYRSVNELDGTTIKKFRLVLKNSTTVFCKLLYQGDIPITINIQTDNSEFMCNRKLSEEEIRSSIYKKHMKVSRNQFQEFELHKLMGD
jgi:PIN domain